MKILINLILNITNYYMALIISVIAFVTCSAILLFKKTIPKPTKIALYIMADSSLIILILFMITCVIAINHGFTKGTLKNNVSIGKMLTSIRESPSESELPDNLNGCIIIYYKFGCPDCEAVYDELKDKLSDKPNVYWASSRSKQGKKLLEKYPVEKVPTGIYIYKNPEQNATDFVQKQLYEKDENNNTILQEDNLNRLLELKSNNQ